VVLVFCVDLQVLASTDKNLDRIGVISGGSIYPFVWNTLLAARNEGYGGTITTLAIAQEPALQKALNIPSHVAIAAIVPMGKPEKQLSKLRRRPMEDIVRLERFDGAPFKG
jgi:nitroreductase